MHLTKNNLFSLAINSLEKTTKWLSSLPEFRLTEFKLRMNCLNPLCILHVIMKGKQIELFYTVLMFKSDLNRIIKYDNHSFRQFFSKNMNQITVPDVFNLIFF